MPLSPTDELERLRSENRLLNEQLKLLVRAERRLAVSQQSLDRQLQNMEVLNRFSLDAAHAERVGDVLQLALETLLTVFPYEQGIGFLRAGEDEFAPAAAAGAAGLEPQAKEARTWTIASHEAWPASPRVGTEDELVEAGPGLAAFLSCFERVFGPDACPAGCPPCRALSLPIPLEPSQTRALLVLRRCSAQLSLHERIPGDEDLAFLSLVAANAAVAIRNLLSLEEAREAIRVREEFLSIASHELKTPLTSLLMLLGQALRRAGPDGSVELASRTLDTLERQGRRLAALVEQLLDVTRIRVGRLTPQLAWVDLVQVTREVAARLGHELGRSGSTLSLHAPRALPLWADRAQMEQVVSNLIANAVKFGEGRPIEVRLASTGEQALFEVVDHGIGIDEADQQRVFGRFERAVSSRAFGGLGLGLYITRQLVEAHGGSIRVRSSPGQGASFTVTLPRRMAASELEPAPGP